MKKQLQNVTIASMLALACTSNAESGNFQSSASTAAAKPPVYAQVAGSYKVVDARGRLVGDLGETNLNQVVMTLDDIGHPYVNLNSTLDGFKDLGGIFITGKTSDGTPLFRTWSSPTCSGEYFYRLYIPQSFSNYKFQDFFIYESKLYYFDHAREYTGQLYRWDWVYDPLTNNHIEQCVELNDNPAYIALPPDAYYLKYDLGKVFKPPFKLVRR